MTTSASASILKAQAGNRIIATLIFTEAGELTRAITTHFKTVEELKAREEYERAYLSPGQSLKVVIVG